jgi:glycosyltransferase involved in cell wall biosynthesis
VLDTVSGRKVRAKERTIRPLFLSNAATIGSTGRILQHWLEAGRRDGMLGRLVVRPTSEYGDWAQAHSMTWLASPMPWLDRRAPWKALYHAGRVARWARKAGVDVIHCNEHDVYPFAQLVRRMLRLPIVCHVRYRLSRDFAAWAFRGGRAPDALLWTSHEQRKDSAEAIEGLAPEARQQVLRLGVDLDEVDRYADAGRRLRGEWGVGDDELLIGLPSPLRPRKRVEDFVEVLRRLAADHPNVVGVIAGQEVPGDEEYRARIQRLVAASGLGRRLRWVGYLSPVEPFHHACDISVSTSEYETFGNSVCEAMACSKPVAAYRGGSVGEVVGDAGMIVETGDLDALTASLGKLVASEELRSRLGEQARERVAVEFNPTKSLQQLMDVYTLIFTMKKHPLRNRSERGQIAQEQRRT